MRPEGRDAAFLWDMLSAARSVVEITEVAATRAEPNDAILRAALERQFIVVGEAARRVSDSLKAAHPEISWSRIIGLRNVLVHQYDDVDSDLLWRTATVAVPELIALLEPLVLSADDAC